MHFLGIDPGPIQRPPGTPHHLVEEEPLLARIAIPERTHDGHLTPVVCRGEAAEGFGVFQLSKPLSGELPGKLIKDCEVGFVEVIRGALSVLCAITSRLSSGSSRSSSWP